MKPPNIALLYGNPRFLKHAFLYNLLVFALFFVIYLFLDFEKHFVSTKPVTVSGKLFYTVMSHTTAGTADIEPKTDTARMITTAHVVMAWMQLVLVFVS